MDRGNLTVWNCVADSHPALLLTIRRLSNETKVIAEQHPQIAKVLPAMRKGYQRGIALDAVLRGEQNKTRWRSLDEAMRCNLAFLIVRKHVKIGPASAPSQKLVLSCLAELDAALNDSQSYLITENSFELQQLVGQTAGWKQMSLINTCVFHCPWMSSRKNAEAELSRVVQRFRSQK